MLANVPLWAPTSPANLPQLVGDVAADACVVGLGGSGLACVHALLDAGKCVVGIDAVDVAHGAAGRNGGFLLGGLASFYHDAVAQIGRDAARAIYEETLKQIDRMTRETPHAVQRNGSLRIAASPAEFEDCERQFDAMRRDGLPVERFEGAEGRGLLFPADGVFDPAVRCGVLAAEAVARGARLFTRSPVVSLDGDGVTLAKGRVRARHVVIALDGRLEAILPELSTRVRSVRLQMLGTAPLPERRFTRPVYGRWGLDYWQQLDDGRLVLGGFRDAGGAAEWTTDDTPSDSVQTALTTFLRDELGVTAAVTHRWAAVAGYTHNSMPILEEVQPGIWAIGGYCGTGNVVGAICGRAAAEMLVHGASPIAGLFRS